MFEKEDLAKLIRKALGSRTPQEIKEKNPASRHAAVLIPLFKQNREYRILFTKRTNTVEAHKGQISFPGGRVDDRDNSFLETALREASEEIGLYHKDLTILGQTDDMCTVVSNYIVHPFVGLIPYPYNFKINKDEVEKLISAPFETFVDGSSLIPVEYQGTIYEGPAYVYGGEVIWGATARIMDNLVGILKEKMNLPLRGA